MYPRCKNGVDNGGTLSNNVDDARILSHQRKGGILHQTPDQQVDTSMLMLTAVAT